MDALIAQIQTLAHATDDAGRLNIQRALQNVQMEIQSPQDVLMQFGNANLLIAMLRLAVDIGIFRQLTKSHSPLTVQQLAEANDASVSFMQRVLRYLASNNMITEVSMNEYRANTITYILADPRGEGMAYHGFDVFGPIVQVMPEFFKNNQYRDITSNTDTPFQKAFNTNLSCFDWLVQHPKHFGSLQKVMTALEGAEWTVGFDLIETEARKIQSSPQPSERPFFVDVGGGHGHQCVQLGKKYPHLLGRLVLQDLPEAIDRLPPIEGVKAEAYDFFQKETITDAKFYYLRRIMHDWPDKEAAVILGNISSVMSSDSRILIDEVVLPDTGAHWQATMADLSMMIAFGGKERSTQQWYSLVDLVGLRVEQIHTYVASTYTSILVLARK
ncbi:S-adenosyl-L-methionine-dependent methyltransferase [Penicillium malachiteum]|uniref:S-adenosyl-L-methionine-dependent methyltransferase n=1 Tax=Penicillium malachiteum TaxID=1324776 RepID=UPI002548FF72|nr:S-adenosyl-L-methionine-dependent methyltransferase [Penicillium malachiteum]KAJ5721361.1 S-adenosyl-L-methionine-dependent methyltransferase [Penicillium malachiteum]